MAAPASFRTQPLAPASDVPPPVDSRMLETAGRVSELELIRHYEATAQLQQERLGLAIQVDALTRQLTQANQTLLQKEALVVQRERQIASLEQTHQEDQQQIQALRGQVEATRNEVASLLNHISVLTTQLQAMVQGRRAELSATRAQSLDPQWVAVFQGSRYVVRPFIFIAYVFEGVIDLFSQKKEMQETHGHSIH